MSLAKPMDTPKKQAWPRDGGSQFTSSHRGGTIIGGGMILRGGGIERGGLVLRTGRGTLRGAYTPVTRGGVPLLRGVTRGARGGSWIERGGRGGQPQVQRGGGGRGFVGGTRGIFVDGRGGANARGVTGGRGATRGGGRGFRPGPPLTQREDWNQEEFFTEEVHSLCVSDVLLIVHHTKYPQDTQDNWEGGYPEQQSLSHQNPAEPPVVSGPLPLFTPNNTVN